MRYSITLYILLIIQLLLITVGCKAEKPIRSNRPLPTLITTEINAVEFCNQLGVPKPRLDAVSMPKGVFYDLSHNIGKKSYANSVTFIVYPTVKEAQQQYDQHFGNYYNGALTLEDAKHFERFPKGTPKIADQFNTSIKNRKSDMKGNAGGNFRFRQGNVIVNVTWTGHLKDAIPFARKMVSIINKNSSACPKGDRVVVPEILWNSSNDINSEISYRTVDGSKVFCLSEISPKLSVTGNIVLGNDKKINFITLNNVIFSIDTSEIHSKIKNKASRFTTEPWDWVGHQLYFTPDNHTNYSSLPLGEKEWLQTERSTFESLENSESIKTNALDEISNVIQSKWLPNPSFIKVYKDHATKIPETMYISAFSNNDLRILYIGTMGKRLWQLLECNDDASISIPSINDVVKPNINMIQYKGDETIYSNIEITSNTFTRWQSYSPTNGPFEKVRIMLIRYDFNNNLDLHNFGYPFARLQRNISSIACNLPIP